MTTTQTIDPAAIVRAVLLGVLNQQGRNEPTRREMRAIDIVAAGGVKDDGRRRWLVQSQSGDQEYRTRNGSCPCKDGNQHCKHLIAVDLLADYARELVGRTCRRDEWNGTADDCTAMHDSYTALIQAASGYVPPADGLLYAFRLEAIGDDAWQRQRQSRLAGQMYVPSRLRDMRPERPWVALINGLCPKYEFHRGFLRGAVDYREADKRGSRGVYLYFALPPGLYEVYERLDHHRSRRYFVQVANLAVTEVSKKEVLTCMTSS